MSAVLNQQGLPAPGLMPASFYALNAPHNRRLRRAFLPVAATAAGATSGQTSVVTGFISRNNAGETVLLGRKVPTIPRHKSVRWRVFLA